MFNHSPQVPTSYFGIISLDCRVIISTPILFWGSRYVSVMADYVNKATQAYSCTDFTSLCFPSSEELSFVILVATGGSFDLIVRYFIARE